MKNRPNVLIIYTDQQRFDTLSCNNTDSPIQTLNIDKIANSGARFNNTFVQNPVCGPSRACFLSSRYCSSTGIGDNGYEFPYDKCRIVSDVLHPYGYQTAQIGKLHFQPHAKRNHKSISKTYGFDRAIISDEPGCYDDPYTKWVELQNPKELDKCRTALPPAAYRYGKKSYSTVPRNTHEPYIFEGKSDLTHSSFVANETVRFIEERDKNRPFFTIAGFYAPHPPINPPKEFLDLVDETKITLPKIRLDEKIEDQLQTLTNEDWIKIRKYYYALTLHVDYEVSKILDSLEKEHIIENTLIIFTSDHGEFLGDHGRIQKGMPGQDCITNVPLLMSYPSQIKPNLVFDELIESIDVIPTILDYCGVQTPPEFQGYSFKPLIEKDENYKKREEVLTENFQPYGLKELRLRTKKYSYYVNSESKELLFDLEQDKNELSNVSNLIEYKDILSNLRFRALKKEMIAAMPNNIPEAEY